MRGRPKKNHEAVKRFAEILNRLLKERGLMQIELAEALGFFPQMVSVWCRGLGMPTRQNMRKLAHFFGVTVEYLKTGKDC